MLMLSKSILWQTVVCLLSLGVIAKPVNAFDWPIMPEPLPVYQSFGQATVGDVWVMARVTPVLGPENTVWFQCRSVLLSYRAVVSMRGLGDCYDQVVAGSPEINSWADFTKLRIGSSIALPLTQVQATRYARAESIVNMADVQSSWEEMFAALRSDMKLLQNTDTSLQTDFEALGRSLVATKATQELRFMGLDTRLDLVDKKISDVVADGVSQRQQLQTLSLRADDYATQEELAGVAQSVGELRQQIEVSQSTAMMPTPPIVTSDTANSEDTWLTALRTVLGVPWWNVLWLLLFGLACWFLLFLFRRQQTSREQSDSLSKRSDIVERRQTVMGQDVNELFTGRIHDMTGCVVTEDMLNDQKLKDIPLVLPVPAAGHGAAIPRIEVYRRNDSKGAPYLELFGGKPGENAVHPTLRNSEYWFELSSFEKRLRRLIDESKVGGLQKSRTRAA